MGDSLEKLNHVEGISLTKLFEEVCPVFMIMGMSYDQFWRDDPTIAKTFLKYYKMKQKNEAKTKKWDMWEQGAYIYEALINVAPILRAFSKATKPLPYPEKPYGIDVLEKDEEQLKKDKLQEEENERLKTLIFLDRWTRETKKRFKQEKR